MIFVVKKWFSVLCNDGEKVFSARALGSLIVGWWMRYAYPPYPVAQAITQQV